MTKGDRQTLAREAEAIAALTSERLAISSCRSCGTPVTDESHSCRRCGAALFFDVPELGGMIALVVAVLAMAFAFVTFGQKISSALLWIAIEIWSYSLCLLVQGMWQLHRTLNSKAPKTVATSLFAPLNASVTAALPPAPARVSVTEGTTELLVTNHPPRVLNRFAEGSGHR